ncbi:acyltransferase family protein [Sinorhizobium terangae]|uniref:acyltransferase family protein n=1 Tax=Sinorhizobium terangae TaxID=110322 RepID=UPI0024B05EA0|nr:acyltransferase [Sinorhizobium terangae]WFU51472.1 acyltransferase [Sinorhizobium terangae]
MKTIHGIQYLRAAAALAVVIFHAAEKTGHYFAIGAAGVDVFFVISGFIMWVISDRRPVTPVRFMVDRIRRIVPIYWLAIMVMVAGGIAGLFPNMVLSVKHALASLFFIPMRSPSNGEIWPVLVQGWTLNFEMLFYAVFALSLFLPRNWRLPAIAGLFLLLVLAGSVISFDNALMLTYTRPVILEFVAGMVIGELWLKGRVPSLAPGVALIVCSFGGFALVGLLRLPFDEFTTGPLAVMLVVGVLSVEARGYIRSLQVPNLLGNASYSIYIWHTFAISVAARAASMVGVDAWIAMVASVLCGTMIGIAGYAMLERPLLYRKRMQPAAQSLAG